MYTYVKINANVHCVVNTTGVNLIIVHYSLGGQYHHLQVTMLGTYNKKYKKVVNNHIVEITWYPHIKLKRKTLRDCV